MQVLDYGTIERKPSFLLSLSIGVAVQIVGVWQAAICMDAGETYAVTLRLWAAYLVGVVIVLVRRFNTLTKGDHWYLRIGLIPILVVGTPIALLLWEHWHVY
jgi:hypothetical protein